MKYIVNNRRSRILMSMDCTLYEWRCLAGSNGATTPTFTCNSFSSFAYVQWERTCMLLIP